MLSCQVRGCPVFILLLDPPYSLIPTAPQPRSSLTSAHLHLRGAKGESFGFMGHRQQSGPPTCRLVSNSPSDRWRTLSKFPCSFCGGPQELNTHPLSAPTQVKDTLRHPELRPVSLSSAGPHFTQAARGPIFGFGGHSLSLKSRVHP